MNDAMSYGPARAIETSVATLSGACSISASVKRKKSGAVFAACEFPAPSPKACQTSRAAKDFQEQQ